MKIVIYITAFILWCSVISFWVCGICAFLLAGACGNDENAGYLLLGCIISLVIGLLVGGISVLIVGIGFEDELSEKVEDVKTEKELLILNQEYYA